MFYLLQQGQKRSTIEISSRANIFIRIISPYLSAGNYKKFPSPRLIVFSFLLFFSAIFYLVSKLIPVKTKFIAIPAIAVFILFIISYTTLKKSSADKPSVATNEKIEARPVVTKVKKKKEKKYVTPTSKSKAETSPAVEKETTKETKAATAPDMAMINILANKINNYAVENGFSTDYCFLIDMNLPSGRNRFFVYDLTRNSVIYSGLVAHGSCNETFLAHPRFSNSTSSGCSSLGKYKVGDFYHGKYGKSYRLYGLDNCNSNAYKRAVVIHGYDCVPDQEIYPRVLCNSLGCVMVSYRFFDKLSRIISNSKKPIVLWIYQ